jgi:hypothetical protein
MQHLVKRVSVTAGVVVSMLLPLHNAGAVEPVLVTGHVVAAGGAGPEGAAGRTVTAVVYPRLAVATTGKPQAGIVVGSATVGGAGAYEIDAVPTASVLATLDPSGLVNLMLSVSGAESMPTWVARRWTGSGWVAPDASPTVSGAGALRSDVRVSRTAPKDVHAQSGICPPTIRRVISSTIRTDKIGVARGGFDMDVTATLGVDSAVGIEVAGGPDTGSFHATGTYRWTSTSGASATENTGSRATQRFDTYVHADFRHYLVQYIPCSGSPWQNDEVGEWTGGLGFGPLNYYAPGACFAVPGAVPMTLGSNGVREKHTGTTYVVGGAASAFGVSLSGESSQSSSYTMTWHAGRRYTTYTICGLDGQGLPTTGFVNADF